LALAGCVDAPRTPIEPRPVANVEHDSRVSASDRRIASAIERCFPDSQRARLRYAAAPYEGGDSPIFIVFFDGGHTAVNALNNDLYYDTSRRIVFPVPGEPSVAPDPAERVVLDCLARARAAAR
jgi:hypothetical protein